MAKREPVRVGVLGCGNISPAYFNGMKAFDILDVRACADLDPARARARAETFGVPHACAPDELLAMDDLELVVNLTLPRTHAAVNRAILEAGKAPHVEKPFAATREDGAAVLALAREKGLPVGCAPDTFLGAGQQTARKLLDDGAIGTPVAATAFMLCPGHESWHPAPEFYYAKGGGPLFDMGPYYLTALVNLLGPMRAVTGMARASFPTRTITSPPQYGKTVPVETPTHVTGVIDFACGALATLVMSFDVQAHRLPLIELYGEDGTLAVPDPNGFGGPVRLRDRRMADWVEMKLTHPHADNLRGIGVADLACALRTGRAPRASGELGYHVLDAMAALLESAETGRRIELASTCERPAALPLPLVPGTLGD